jgi:hypothetical protein
MKKITVAVDDETYRRARMKAAEQRTCVSALVKSYLTKFATRGTDAENLKREERAIRQRIHTFRARDRPSREDGRGA